ncbi:MAG: ABC transporter permease [Longimicrobiales bacterium]
MSLRFALRHASRESRAAARRIGPYMLSITLGVGALVAIHSYRTALLDVVDEQARDLLGGDVRLSAETRFSPAVRAALDSAQAAGVTVAQAVALPSMATAEGGRVQLVQLRAVSEAFPIYGEFVLRPADGWRRVHRGEALVEPAVLRQLGVEVGDTILLGLGAFRIGGTVEDALPALGPAALLGARVYVARGALARTGLLVTGSLARQEAFLRLPGEPAIEAFLGPRDSLFRADQVDVDTARERAEDLTRALDALSRFLALVGLLALLLGGIGVASAVGIYVRERIPSIAVLRCLGASQRDVFLSYGIQTALLGLVGSALGVLLGVAAFAALRPVLMLGIPFRVPFRVEPVAVVAGLGTGVWVASIFALVPLLEVREVTPLQALRRDFEPIRAPIRLRAAVLALLAASVLALAAWQAPTPQIGVLFAAGIAAAIALLRAAAAGLVQLARRLVPAHAEYTLRQGISNLFRPRNQTVAITLALGFGVFAVGSLLVVQRSVLAQLRLDTAADAPDLLFFDVQRDQRARLAELVEQSGGTLASLTPIVPARLAGINGRSVEQILADTTSPRPERWALRREYRNTYRETLSGGETLAAGGWWDDAPATEIARVSVEADLADDLRIGIGDTLLWDVQGVEIASRVTSLRSVDWSRFEPNFFVVFEPGPLDDAPQTFVALATTPDDSARAGAQFAVSRALANVIAVDLARVQSAIRSINLRVTLGVGSLGALSIAAGVVVLFGAVATSRRQRMRESALLRALGADRARVRRILLTEYAALGLLAAIAGALLAGFAGAALVHWFFELPLDLPVVGLLGLIAAVVLLTVAVGALGAREALRGPPLAVLREAE